MTDFREIKEWEKAHEMTVAIYEATGAFPEKELMGLTQQIRDSSAEVPIKIAQGCAREEREEKVKFMEEAGDSAIELEYYLLLSYDLELLSGLEYDRLVSKVVEVKQLLESLIERLSASS
jgi:four helix bundle protein